MRSATGTCTASTQPRAAARAHLWSQLADGVPQARYAGGHTFGPTIVLRVDATISLAHSAKQNAAPTFKKNFGFHTLGVWIDNTHELGVLMPRPGNAGSNTAADLIEVLRAAIMQVPADRRDDLLITSDGAGASHTLIDWLTRLNTRGRRVRYSIGFDVDEHVRAAAALRRDDRWQLCLDNTTGDLIDSLECAEITDLLHDRLTALAWPGNMRIIVRRRKVSIQARG